MTMSILFCAVFSTLNCLIQHFGLLDSCSFIEGMILSAENQKGINTV